MRSLGLSAFCLALACRQAPAQWAPQPPDAVDVPLQLCVTSSFSGTHSAPLSCQTPKPRGGVISKPTSKIQTWGPRLRFCTKGHRQGSPEHTSRVAYRPLILLVSVEATLRVRAPTPRGRPWSHSCSKRASPEIPALAGARRRRLCSQTGRARAEAALQLHPRLSGKAAPDCRTALDYRLPSRQTTGKLLGPTPLLHSDGHFWGVAAQQQITAQTSCRRGTPSRGSVPGSAVLLVRVPRITAQRRAQTPGPPACEPQQCAWHWSPSALTCTAAHHRAHVPLRRGHQERKKSDYLDNVNPKSRL